MSLNHSSNGDYSVYSGGITAYNYDNGKIDECCFDGQIKAIKQSKQTEFCCCGGITGYNNGEICDSYALVNARCINNYNGNVYLGGITGGSTSGYILNVYAIGKL